MASQHRILIAFLLNLFFSLTEAVGGILTGSVSVLSDAVHDLGDSIGIGFSYLLERMSKKSPDAHHTYGYIRYSVLGSLITNLLVTVGSAAVVIASVSRLVDPVAVDHNGMFLLALLGILVNGAAAFFTHRGESLNQKAVSLHLLEDLLGWVCVLVGSVVIRVTGFVQADALISIGVAVFLTYHALKGMKAAMDVFLDKTPDGIDVDALTAELASIEGVRDVHHLHLRSLDGFHHAATVHIVTDADPYPVRRAVERCLSEHGTVCVTVQTERSDTVCAGCCHITPSSHHHHR